MQFYDFNYLAPTAKKLIPKWALNWKHPELIPEFREAYAELSGEEREKHIFEGRMVGWRLKKAFEADDECERDWLIFDARHVNAIYSNPLGAQVASRPDVIVMALWHPLDRLLRVVQTRLAKYMAICHREDCERKYYFREPGRHGQKYCGLRCSEIVNREGKLRWYHESPNSRKNRLGI